MIDNIELEEKNSEQFDLKNNIFLRENLLANRIRNVNIVPNEQNIKNIFVNNSFTEEENITTPSTLHNQEEEHYTLKYITEMFKKNEYPINYSDILRVKSILGKDNEKYEKYLQISKALFITKKKRKRGVKNIKIIESKVKHGRKKKGVISQTIRNKESDDNIMRKIKVYIFKYLIKFCNIYISNEKKLVNLNYKKYISNLKIDLNIGMLNTSLKDLLSYETTKKYKKYRYDTKNYNKNIIDSILIKEANNKNIMKLLNMKFIDWIDIYLLKKKAEDEIQFDGLSSILSDLISNYPDEEDIAYIKKFIINLYNYKNWFQRKIGRIGKKPKSN